jgi:hypothetical protein
MSGARPSEPADDHPSGDDVTGMAWWAALSEVKRLFWLTQAAGSAAGASAASAWAAFKRADPSVAGTQTSVLGDGAGEEQP